MPLLEISHENDLSVIKLNNGVTNAISPDLVSELQRAINDAKNNSRGILISGGEKFFSIGFDLPVLIQLERQEFEEFWSAFNGLYLDIYTLPLPTICLLQGHAVAGGAVLALASDYRYGSKGKKQFGLNEIKLGIPVPYLTDLMLRQIVGDRVATEIIYTGEFMLQENCTASGLLDYVDETETIHEQALEKLGSLASFSGEAFAINKQMRVEAVVSAYQKSFKDKDQSFLNLWFDSSVQEKLKQAASQF